MDTDVDAWMPWMPTTLTARRLPFIKKGVKPMFFASILCLAAALVVQAQPSPPTPAAATPTNEPTSVTQTNAPREFAPAQTVQNRLKQIEVDAPVTYSTNGNVIFCTVRCKDLDQRNAVYDGFSNLPKVGLTATKNPPSVTVVLLLDPAKYFSEQQNQRLNAKLHTAETNLIGKVVQKTPEGMLISLPDSQLVLVADPPPNLNEGDPFKATAYYIGPSEIIDKNGARKTLRKYTCDLAAATDHWTPQAASEAKAETQKRAQVPE